jgi:hypothetical protein
VCKGNYVKEMRGVEKKWNWACLLYAL